MFLIYMTNFMLTRCCLHLIYIPSFMHSYKIQNLKLKNLINEKFNNI